MDRVKLYVKAFKRAIMKSFARVAKKGGNIGKALYLVTVLPILFAIDFLVDSFEGLFTHKRLSKVTAGLLAFTLVFTSIGITSVYADLYEGESKDAIVSFETLSENVANQKLEIGASESEINFPDTLSVTVEKAPAVDEEEIEEEILEEETSEEETTSEETEEVTEETPEEIPAEAPAEEPAPEVPAEPLAPVVEEVPVEEVPIIEDIPAEVPAPVEEAPVEAPAEPEAPAAPEAPAEPAPAFEGDGTASILNLLFPAITVKAAEIEEEEVAEEPEEAITAEEPEEAVATEESQDINTDKDEGIVIEEVLLSGVTWRIVPERSTAAEFDSTIGGAVYIYVPVIPGDYNVKTSLPTITVTIEEEMAFEQSAVVDGVTIIVKADEGVFPEGAYIAVRRATEAEQIVFESAVEDIENRGAGELFVADITVFDKEGNEIQPDTSKGKVYVSFTMAEIAEAEVEANMYHIPDSENGATEAEKLNATTQGATAEAEISSFCAVGVCISSTADVIGNEGYPYGKNLNNGLNLAIRLKDGAATVGNTYQWQKSATKDAADEAWTNIEGATGQELTDPTPSNQWWYRCIVNGHRSKAVLMVQPNSDGRRWTYPKWSWYVSNGTMAYSTNGTYFDVSGLYLKNGTTYMLQTTYGSAGWDMATTSGCGLDGLYFRFSDSEAYAVYIDADLADGQTGFSFGSDTQLGNSTTSGSYSDAAALEAIKNDDNTLKQVAMIGAASSEEAAETDPAFVISPITRTGLKFWLGVYYERGHFSFNTTSTDGTTFGDVTVDGTKHDHVALKCLRTDSGMTMSWSGVPSGGIVSFLFSVGDVASTGAVGGNVNYQSEVIEGFEENTTYVITVDGDTTGTTYEITANASGQIPFEGVAKDAEGNDISYSFVGKSIVVSKKDSNDQPANIDVADRPTAVEVDSAGYDMDIDALRPSEVGSDAVVTSEDSITLNIDTLDADKMAQQYRIYDEDGNEMEGYGWVSPDRNGNVVFTGLDDNTTYTVRSRLTATSNRPASLPTTGISVTTIGTLTVTEPTAEELRNLEYDGTNRDFGVTSTDEDAVITYSTDPNAEYTATVPTFTDAGDYTVYYKVTKPGFRTYYGSYNVHIDKKEHDDVDSEVTKSITIDNPDDTGNVLDFSTYLEDGETIFAYQFGGDIANYVHETGIVEKSVEYAVNECPEGTEGYIQILVRSKNYEDYVLTIPVRAVKHIQPKPVVVAEESVVKEEPVAPIPEIPEISQIFFMPEEETENETTDDAAKKNADETVADVVVIEKGNIVDAGEIWDDMNAETKVKLLEKLDEKSGEIFRVDEALTLQTENADKIVVKNKPVALVMGEGAIVVTMEVTDEEKTRASLADANAVAKSLLTEEQLAQVAAGSVFEIKVEVTPIEQEAVPELDAQVISDGVAEYAESNPNMAMADYIDISMYFRVDDADWEQITETEAFDIVIDIPDRYKGLGSAYYIMRAHNGKSTLLSDLDDNDDTITISTGQFSTYALMYDEIIVPETIEKEDSSLGTVWMIAMLSLFFFFIILFYKRRKEEEKENVR